MPKQMTVVDLQKELVKFGIPEAEAKKIQSKTALEAVLKSLKQKEKVAKQSTSRSDEKKWRSDRHKMFEVLESQPKVLMFIPTEGKEKPGKVRVVKDSHGMKHYVHVSGAVKAVTINGYQMLIPKGVEVRVPQQVAEMIKESLGIVSEAAQKFKLDRIDEKTGQKVADILA